MTTESAAMPSNKRRGIASDVAWVVALSVIAYALTSIPYNATIRSAPPGSIFVGQVAVADDINSYYSFIRQAVLGHFFFRNTMTYIDHGPAFINIEYFAIGVLMRVFGWTPPFAFTVWRIVGIVALLGGFAVIARVLLRSEFQRRVALMMCALGGGFGWLLTILIRAGIINVQTQFEILNPALDLTTGIHPFQQMTRNPHYSLPHGTFLLAFACMALGEQSRRTKWYAAAAAFAFIHGLMRPYDLISLFIILPAFVALEVTLTRKIEWRWSVVRCIPLFATAPLLVYYMYLFQIHPVFKYWSSQGGHPDVIPIRWHLLALGIPLLLFTARTLRWPAQPFTNAGERLVFVWGACLVVLFHAYRVLHFMPYSPQLAVPSVTPLILIGVTLLPTLTNVSAAKQKLLLTAGIVLVCVNSLSTPIYLRQESRRSANDPTHYVRTADIEAVQWLNTNVKESDVILAKNTYGSRISQYLNARVAIGHWALSPHFNDLVPRIDKFIDGNASPEEASALLEQIRPDYIYVSREEDAPVPAYFDAATNMTKEFENAGVAIYAIE